MGTQNRQGLAIPKRICVFKLADSPQEQGRMGHPDPMRSQLPGGMAALSVRALGEKDRCMNKFHNVKTNGYDSKKEAKRAYELQMMERAGKIKNLRMQVPYIIIPKQSGEREARYILDFQYEQNGEMVFEDCKGMRTAAYILKRKLMLLVHGIRILET